VGSHTEDITGIGSVMSGLTGLKRGRYKYSRILEGTECWLICMCNLDLDEPSRHAPFSLARQNFWYLFDGLSSP
jgi:hypothetical protein